MSDKSHIPDHNLLVMQLEMSLTVQEHLVDRNLGSVNVQRQKVHRKTGNSYMSTDVAMRLLGEMLDEMEELEHNQLEVDRCYNSMVEFILEEAEHSASELTKKRRNTKFREYWDKELSAHWHQMHNAE